MKTNQAVEGLVAAVMLGLVTNAPAMPSKQEINKAQPLVAELMAPAMDDYKAKKKTAAEVADAAVAFAAEAKTEAAKFMLYRSSIPYYVRGGAYDKAAEALTLLKSNVKDVPAEVVVEIISKATVRANKEKAPRLFELYRQAKTQATAEKDVRELRKNPASPANRRKLAEALATAGNWSEALKEFASLRDDTAQMAKKEQDGSAKSAALGEFWWTYKPTYENAEDTFKIHSAYYYRKALAADEITGLKKNIVEQRIKEYAEMAEVVPVSASTTALNAGSINLKTGGDSPFAVKGNEATLKLPNGEVIEFRLCPAGKFKMFRGQGASSDVTMSRPFWMSKTPITGKAAENAVGPKAKVRRRYCAYYSPWSAEKVLSWMRSTYCPFLPEGAVLRQASIAELQYAFGANEKAASVMCNFIAKGDDAKMRVFCDYKGERKTVPNAWGFYDFPSSEYVLDRINEDSVTDWENKDLAMVRTLSDPLDRTDPLYWADDKEGGQYIVHQGLWQGKRAGPFHLVIGPDLVSEWKAKNAKK